MARPPKLYGRYAVPKRRKRLRRKDVEQVAGVMQSAIAAAEGIGTDTLTAFIPHLMAARDELIKAIKEWSRVEGGNNRFTAVRYRNALAQVNRVLLHYRKTHPELSRQLGLGSKRIGGRSLIALEKELASLHGIFEGSVAPIAIDQAAAIASQKNLLLKRHNRSARRYQGALRDRITREMAIGLLRKQTIDEITERMVENVPRIFSQARYKAERLVRTEMMHSYNAHHRAGIEIANEELDPEDRYLLRWDASFDRRRCIVCGGLEGEIIATDASFGKGVDHPPAHPN